MLSIEFWLMGGGHISLRHCLPKVGRWAMNLNALPSLTGLVFGRPDGGSTSIGARGGLVNGEIESVETLFSPMKKSDKEIRFKVGEYWLQAETEKQSQPI